MQVKRDLRFIAAGISLALFLMNLSPASASSANISHSYNENSSIALGSAVSLSNSKTNYVVPTNTGNSTGLIGIVVATNDSLIAEDPSPSNNSVQVATTGSASTLVSTINGPINVGDQISVSPFDGIGMKAIAGAPIIGVAQTSFNSNSQGAISKNISSTSGKSFQIYVGFVKLEIAIGQGSSASNNAEQLNGIQEFSKSLTGHAVSTVHVVVSIIIAAVTIIAIISLIYASICGGIISIGRNPLAKYSILKSMVYVMGMVAFIVIVACLIIFLLLR